MQRTVILVATNGGRGHIDAIEHYKDEYSKKKSDTKIVMVNITEDKWLSLTSTAESYGLSYVPLFNSYLTYNYGAEGTNDWNEAQKKGDLKKLKELISKQPIANAVFYNNFKSKMKQLLEQHKDTVKVITSQPIGLDAIHDAISEHNQTAQTKISLTLVLTDLPTEHAIHFKRAIESIKASSLEFAPFHLHTPLPIVKWHLPTLTDYYNELREIFPNLFNDKTNQLKTNANILFTLGPINEKFQNIHEQISKDGEVKVKQFYKNQPVPVQLTSTAIKTLENMIPNTYALFEKKQENRGGFSLFSGNPDVVNKFEIRLQISSKVETVMLGSQASIDGVQKIIQEAYIYWQKNAIPHDRTKTYLFVFCGDDKKPDSLFNILTQRLSSVKYNERFIIIPLTNQDKTTISHLYTIADLKNIRAGGLSTLEVEAVSSGKIIVYAESSPAYSNAELMQDPTLTLIQWELGNATHLQQKFRNRVIIANQYSYQEARTELDKNAPEAKVTIINDALIPLMKKCETAIKKLYFAHPDCQLLTIGAAIYELMHPNTTIDIHDQYEFANCYFIGHDFYVKKIGKNTHHPLMFATNFAIALQKKLSDGPITTAASDNSYSQHIAYCATYANAFYRYDEHYLTQEEAHLYADKNKDNINVKDYRESTITFTPPLLLPVTQDDMLEFTPLSANSSSSSSASSSSSSAQSMGLITATELGKCNTLWKDNQSYAKNIIDIFNNYANPTSTVGQLRYWRNAVGTAKAIVEKMETIPPTDQNNPQTVKNYLDQSLVGLLAEVSNKQGTCMQRIQYVQNKLNQAIAEEMNASKRMEKAAMQYNQRN